MDETKDRLNELLEAARVACERERREESDITPEEFAKLHTDPAARERRRRSLIREARANFTERRDKINRNK